MAFTVSIVRRNTSGAARCTIADLTFDNSYSSGGEAITPAELRFQNSIDFLVAAPTGGLYFEFDHANKKLLAFYPTGGATTAPAALANPIVTTGASTASAVDATQPNITPGKGKEVKASTDLSTITCRVLAWGDNPYV